MSAVDWTMTKPYTRLVVMLRHEWGDGRGGVLYVVKHVMVATNSSNLKAFYIPHGEGMSKFLKTKNDLT